MYAAPLGVFGGVSTRWDILDWECCSRSEIAGNDVHRTVFFTVCRPAAHPVGGRRPAQRSSKSRRPVTLGFATASSEATLPSAIEQLKNSECQRKSWGSFFRGTVFNMDGASLYQSLGLFFVVQAAGLHLSIGQQVMMILTLLVSSKGTAAWRALPF